MNRQPVSSSNIASIGYDPTGRTLEIEFHSGGIYQYYEVSQNLYENLMAAASHGEYFDQNIKGHYGDTKVG